MLKVFLAFALACGWAFAADVPAVPGVPNFHQVDQHLYRGAQPSREGFQNLANLGVKTVIDLREPGDRSRNEDQIVTAAGMHYIAVPLNGYHAPSNDQINRLLTLLNQDPGPIFIHCRRGADRTGTVVACYRISHQSWPNDKALAEAKQFGMSWTEVSMQNFVRHFAQSAFTGIPAQAILAH